MQNSELNGRTKSRVIKYTNREEQGKINCQQYDFPTKSLTGQDTIFNQLSRIFMNTSFSQ